ncbi:translation machinery-associated protein 20 [Dimargaris cristalligena]|uniref:Translation machinery-associated protein 20 n=1 Tax=Dimargaris cristalligena TaxID=215637 RepID=A0A4Q0A1Y7_9FUNG|nr:translation machinery-associated protein 20 [Dimargaris cristalligena]RKP40074.1 PUA-like domain-containing protein [Dimargaris cristalligena]|eukprot:RKP40074.1 PUA-like domain-containing protein [Dimargaris cristalligena]
MFKKVHPKEDIASQSQVKSSVQRNIRTKLLDQMPELEKHLDELMPKKAALTVVKLREHISLVVVNGEVLFFNHFDEAYYPTLKLLHKYPALLPKLQVDRGAIRFVLSGANIMCPGLTSPGARMDVSLPEGRVVAIMAEGKEHALAVGITKMSTDDIRQVNKGHGVDTIHYLGDQLWKSLFE